MGERWMALTAAWQVATWRSVSRQGGSGGGGGREEVLTANWQEAKEGGGGAQSMGNS